MARFLPGNPGGPGRPKGKLPIPEARLFLQRLINDTDYQQKFLDRAKAGSLAPALEIFAWAHVVGQPKHRVEHTGLNDGPIGVSVVPVSALTDHQLDVIEQVLAAGALVTGVVPVDGPEKPQ